MKGWILPEQQELFSYIAKNVMCTKSAPSYVDGYQDFVEEHKKRRLAGCPIEFTTFYRWCQSKISEKDWILSREGKTAWRRQSATKTGTFFYEGFMSVVEADALWEPIKLLSSETLRPRKNIPIWYSNVEASTGAVVGYVTDYLTGAERADFVIESIKQMLLPKGHWQSTYGSRHPYIMYGKPYLWLHDAGPGYKAINTDEILNLAYVDGGTTKTQSPEQKPHVEAANNTYKREFTFQLPGHYKDSNSSKTNVEYVQPVLTDLEHEILQGRYISDEYSHREIERYENGNTIYQQWQEEVRIFGSFIPDRIQQVIEFQGISDSKVIQESVGIQIQRKGKKWSYNSNELQDLRVRMNKSLGKNWNKEIYFRKTLALEDFITVYDPMKKENLHVPLVSSPSTASQSSKRLEGINGFLAQFSVDQKLDILATRTREQIIETAEGRRKLIDHYIRERRKNNKKTAEYLENAVKNDLAYIQNLYKQGGCLNEHGESDSGADEPEDPVSNYDDDFEEDTDYGFED